MAKRSRSASERAAQAERLRSRPARGRMLAAARELANAHGYEQLRVGELAERAGVSRETFYTHFADKRACLAEATDARLGEIEQLLRMSIEEGEAEWADSLLASVDEQIAQRFGAARGPRAKILTTMVELVAARGLAGTRLADVIKAAHVSYPSFYRHFESKEQCFEIACEWLVEGLRRRAAAAVEMRGGEGPDGAAKLAALAELLAAEPATARVLLVEAGGPLDARPAASQCGRVPTGSAAPPRRSSSPSSSPLAALIEPLLAEVPDDERPREETRSRLLAGSILETMRAATLRGELTQVPARTRALLDLLQREPAHERRPTRAESGRSSAVRPRRQGRRQVSAVA